MLIRRASVALLAVTSAAATCVACAFASTPHAGAATTIGEAYYLGSGLGCDAFGGTLVQSASPGNSYAAPYDGVITSWTTSGEWTTVTFKMARLGAGNSFTVLASDGPRTTPPGQLTTFPARIPVRQGDVLAAHKPVGPDYCNWGEGTWGRAGGDVPSGTTSYFNEVTPGWDLPLEATIERDRDNDGYGDETQDGCPTNAATQGPCPLPTTLGQVVQPFSGGQTCNTSTRIVVDSPGVVSAAPHDGVVTAWSHLSQAEVGTGTIRLKMVRPVGGNVYRAVGESAPQRPAPSRLNTYPVRIPVRQGDRIGLALNGPVPCYQYTAPGTYARLNDQDLAVGSQATFFETNGALDIAAVLEADADGDGYGDTTQDKCPTDATTQGTCPVKPPVDVACEKAKAKLSKAKAKLTKLRKDDASVKKVKKARKAVKRAKGKVKKEC